MTTTILTALVLGTLAGLAPGPYTTMVAGTALEKGFKAGFILAWVASHSRKLMNPDWRRRTLKGVGVTLILAGSFLCWQATVGNFQGLIDQQEIIRSVVEEGISTR